MRNGGTHTAYATPSNAHAHAQFECTHTSSSGPVRKRAPCSFAMTMERMMFFRLASNSMALQCEINKGQVGPRSGNVKASSCRMHERKKGKGKDPYHCPRLVVATFTSCEVISSPAPAQSTHSFSPFCSVLLTATNCGALLTAGMSSLSGRFADGARCCWMAVIAWNLSASLLSSFLDLFALITPACSQRRFRAHYSSVHPDHASLQSGSLAYVTSTTKNSARITTVPGIP